MSIMSGFSSPRGKGRKPPALALTPSESRERPSFWIILSTPHLAQQFRLFLEKRLCLENLLFWVDVQQYQLSPSDVSDSSLLVHAQQICRKFLEDNSPFALNVDATHIKKIYSAVESKLVTRTLFIDAQNACLNLLQTDSVPKFLASDFYKCTIKNEMEISGKEKKQQKKSERRTLKILADLRDGLLDGRPMEIDIEKDCIVEFEAPDIAGLCEAMEDQIQEDEDWIRQSEAAVALASATVYMQTPPGNDQRNGEVLYNDMRNELVWTRQVETTSALFACQTYRRTFGFLALLGRKWLSWDSRTVLELEKLPAKMPEEEVPFVVSTPVYQTALMNVFEITRMVMIQFPNQFEFSSDFVVLVLKLMCSNLPGVSLLPLLDDDDEELEIPEFSTLRDLSEFIDQHAAIFINPQFQFDSAVGDDSVEEGSSSRNSLLLPHWKPEEVEHIKETFDAWNSSITSFLLQELLRVDQQRQTLADTLVSVHNSKQTNVLYTKEIVSFLKSLEDVTPQVVASPRPGEKKRSRNSLASTRDGRSKSSSRKFLHRNRTTSDLNKTT